MINKEKYRIYKKYNGEYAVLSDHRTGDKKDLEIISEAEFHVISCIEDNVAMIKTCKYSEELVLDMKVKIESIARKFEFEIYNELIHDLSIHHFKHEVWESPEGLTTFCLSEIDENGARTLIENDSQLIHYIYANSHFEAMTLYYSYMGWGSYESEFEEDYKSYKK